MPNQIPGKGNYNFIDLFAGAGGLSEGFIQAGFNPIAHVEMNKFATQTLIKSVGHLLSLSAWRYYSRRFSKDNSQSHRKNSYL